MPGRGYNTQKVSANGRVEWPSGPFDVNPGFTPTWVEAWVVQGGPATQQQAFITGPSQSTSQSSWFGFTPPAGGFPGEWEATEPGWRNGRFTPSPSPTSPEFAIGIALMALRDQAPNPTYQYEWWVEVVQLVP